MTAGKIAGRLLKLADQAIKFEKVPELTRILRLGICEGCVNFKASTRQCKLCACDMDIKTAFKYKPGTELLITCSDKEKKW